jgi:MYXO-CTERM domain-containing protein
VCSPPLCFPGQFVPGADATVPANLPGIYWQASPNASPAATPANVTLATTADPSTPLSFTATQQGGGYVYLLVPDAPLLAGTTYVLTDSTPCQFGGTTDTMVTFTVAPSAPLPTTIGALAVTDLPPRRDTFASSGGSCAVETLAASAAVSVDRDAPELAPWIDVMHFETRVDGNPWYGRSSILQVVPPGASWVGRGFDRIYTGCSDAVDEALAFDLSEGPHRVEMRATLPGTTLALATDTRNVTLTCPPPPDGDAGTGGDGGNGAIGEADGGCCSSSSPRSSAWLALGVIALLARRRRDR